MDCPNRKRSLVAGELPEDSLAEILARVPVKCLCRSKCVAKTWRDLIEDPFHRKKLPQTLQGFFLIKHETCGLRIDYASLLARPRPAPLQIDPSLSFLKELPGYETLTFSDSCNGLLVFEHRQRSSPFEYVVWNPATKQWAEVPRYGPPPASMYEAERYTYLVFDPASSSHFHLVQFLWRCKEDVEEGFVVDEDGEGYGDEDEDEDEGFVSSVHAYSSETGQWVHVEGTNGLEGWRDQCLLPCQRSCRCALLNGMLHFTISGQDEEDDEDQIAAVDAQGVTRKIIPVPMKSKHWLEHGNVAQSQGRLHYIKQAAGAQLCVWVLEDYDTQEWVLKHSVSFMELFGKMRRQCGCGAGHKNGYSVVGMHPDGNVVFVVQNWDRKLISYDMDHKVVSVIGTLENDPSTMDVVPYVPCFLELPALTNMH